MNPNDPNIATLELVAKALGPLCDQLVLVGGCSVGLLLTDEARPPVRQTIDVDLIAEVVTLSEYYKVCDALKGRGFIESPDAKHLCRWRNGNLILDVMPSDQKVLGHSTNTWYPIAVKNAQELLLPSGTKILMVSAPLFLATKLESFNDRGGGDYSHHDMEDIINVVDGRPELPDEMAAAPDPVKQFVQEELDALLADQAFTDSVPMHLRPSAHEQARLPIVIDRLRKIAGL